MSRPTVHRILLDIVKENALFRCLVAENLKKKLPFYGLEMNDTTYVVIAIVAALGLLGVVAITVVTFPLQQAEAGCEKGLPQSARAFNASQGRCFNP
jgi:hypothetical protein